MLQFSALSSSIDVAFWETLSKLKMEEWMLDDSLQPVSGTYKPGQSLMKNEIKYGLPCRFFLAGAEAFTEKGNGYVPGVLKNTNTLPDFKAFSFNTFLKQCGERTWNSIMDGSALVSPSLLNQFGMVTYADLKKFKYYYWCAFPALMPSTPYTSSPVVTLGEIYTSEERASLTAAYESFRLKQPAQSLFFLIKKRGQEFTIAPLATWHDFWADVQPESITLGFVDPSGHPMTPGWPLRNALLMLERTFGITGIAVIGYRADMSESIHLTVEMAGGSSGVGMPAIVGWENGPKGKPGPRVANLGPMMDPKLLAETAVDLNLKLMRWRILPSLNLEKIAGTKCLLLGSGTLGCYVARMLMAWGVRHITFVDNGKVSFSNPVRQPLFNFTDCLDGGLPKAQAAADNLRKVFPGLMTEGHDLSIPMPGHSIDSDTETLERIERLRNLIKSHDAVFLLTDSRESRWLPTLLGAVHQKIVINTALGFDSFLVMRHGIRDATNPPPERLGCYFCNDVVAPVDSLTDRTLDQQCTVTRPGLSGLAGAVAVELLASLLNHPDGPRAKADAGGGAAVSAGGAATASPLGIVPHQVRGFLAQFSNLLLLGMGYDKCTACSDAILAAYASEGDTFLLEALRNPDILEKVAGLTQMKQAMEEEDFAWDDEDAEEVE